MIADCKYNLHEISMELGDSIASGQLGQRDEHFLEVGQIVQHHRIEHIRFAQSVNRFAYRQEMAYVLAAKKLQTYLR